MTRQLVRGELEPVFIIGAARSGTKLLRDMLAIHPEVDLVPYDINYVWRYGQESLAHDQLDPEQLTVEMKARIRAHLTEYHNQGRFLVEKTVSNCLRVPFVRAVYPNARFISLYRDGYDVIESAYRQWLAPPDWRYIMQKARQFPFRNAPGYALSYARQAIANALVSDGKRIGTWGPRYQGIDEDVTHHGVLITCAIQWSQCIEAADMGLLPCSPEQLLPIKYEMLVSQPQRELQRVAQWLDLDMAPYRDLADRIAVSAENIGKGRRLLSQTQVATIEPHIEHAMELIGNAR